MNGRFVPKLAAKYHTTNSEKAIFQHFLLKIIFDIICFTQEARFFCDLRLQNLHTVLVLFIRHQHFYRRLHAQKGGVRCH
jgi:hypothetical protein